MLMLEDIAIRKAQRVEESREEKKAPQAYGLTDPRNKLHLTVHLALVLISAACSICGWMYKHVYINRCVYMYIYAYMRMQKYKYKYIDVNTNINIYVNE